MTYVICVLILFSICLIAKNPKSRHTYFFVLMTVGLIGMIGTSIRLWGYEYSDIWFFEIDYKVLQNLIKSNWNYYGMMNYFNISIVLYMTALQLFVFCGSKDRERKFVRVYAVSFTVFAIVYLWFYNSSTALEIFFASTSSENSKRYIRFVSASNWFVLGMQTFYILFPAIRMLYNAGNEKLWPKRNRERTYGLYILTISIFVLGFFVYGPLRNNYLEPTMSLFLGIRKFFKISVYHYAILIAIICVFVIGTFVVMLRGKMLITMAAIRRKIFKNKWTIDAETREIFHMLKNILFNIEAAAKQGISSESIDEKDKRLKSISNMCEKRICDFFEITSVSNMREYDIKPIPISEIVEEALKRINIADDIRITYQNLADDDLVYADFVTMTEAIVNVMKNAIESFDGTDKKEKNISIQIQNDDELVCVDITDNGKGMDRKETKVSFKPLYTTKNRNNNWGVGLASVYKTILVHCGHIKISSIKGSGTRVSIILYRKEAYRLWKR